MFIEVVFRVLELFILIFLGVILSKAKILNDTAVSSVTDLVLLTVAPCVIIKSFVRPFDKDSLKALLLSILIAFLIHVGFILLSRLLIHDKDERVRRVLQFGVIFSNCGFMSLPLQESLLGDEGVFYGASFIAVFNLIAWSYGIITISGDKKYLTVKKMLINPGIIGFVLGVVIFVTSCPLPKIILEPVSYMASLNTPLPMIIIGYHLSKSNLIKGLTDIKCLFAILLRNVLFPLAVVGALYLSGIRGTLLVSSTLSSCAPTAAITAMFSAKFGKDTELATNMISLGTLFSVVTIPLVVSLAQFLA